ncbi:PadR family transcriptional regulator [Streptomyces sp. GC420]|uniref:PadR family transcriptional regulator n=1 Tax=Streptomyces sp. GC420 TaxID=2697568 RepID=UPI001414E412|nr:PadR family transcriptional regulator [Streptomyces sp. GC420]NBM20105.1 PadR family transcriptional regulator [Streptomyces sp. GC420]
MPPVFAHGRLRLYLLKLLDEAPRHGYEVIRLLEERFHGLYAPSAGTVYPRLAKLEAEGLVTHATEGGRKVYSITDSGRAELAGRSGELADLELEIRESVSELAAEIRDDVRGAAGDLRREMRAAASEARTGAAGDDGPEAWRTAKEEMRRAKQEWKEQARRAKDESRRAREEAQRARRQAKEAQESAREELQRMAKRVQDQVQDHFARGDWPTGVREGLAEITKELGGLARTGVWPPYAKPETADANPAGADTAGTYTTPAESQETHGWAEDTEETGNPARDLDRLLDRFRDDIRDAARDHGVTAEQLREARRHLSTAAAHIGVILRPPRD